MSDAHILVVDDEPDIGALVQEILEDEGYQVTLAANGAAAREARRARRPDLILLDIWMPDVDGVTLLKEWAESSEPGAPVVMMSGHATVETAVEATRLGAYDFIEKPLSLAKLLLTVHRALQADRLARENAGLKARVDEVIEPVGKSAAMRELREQARRLAGRDDPVLIRGEPGSGRRCVARYLHSLGLHADGPFLEMSVGNLAGRQAVVELFGSEEDGKTVRGMLERTAGGSLYLDELADLDPQAQAQLLSALTTGRFHRLRGEQALPLTTRVIAATARDLEQEVRHGRLRKDLYYQLSALPLRVPALREHVEDVPDLLGFFVDRIADREKLPYRRFALAAQNRLRNHGWPGNVRELRNLVQRLVILGEGEEIGVAEVEAALAGVSASAVIEGSDEFAAVLELPLREAREHFERLYLQHQLKKAQGSVGQLAKLTGMERTNLYRKLKALGIDPKDIG